MQKGNGGNRERADTGACTVKVDGRIGHGFHSRQHLSRKVQEKIIGDIGFADDTTLVGEAEEMRYAEPLLERDHEGLVRKSAPGQNGGFKATV